MRPPHYSAIPRADMVDMILLLGAPLVTTKAMIIHNAEAIKANSLLDDKQIREIDENLQALAKLLAPIFRFSLDGKLQHGDADWIRPFHADQLPVGEERSAYETQYSFNYIVSDCASDTGLSRERAHDLCRIYEAVVLNKPCGDVQFFPE